MLVVMPRRRGRVSAVARTRFANSLWADTLPLRRLRYMTIGHCLNMPPATVHADAALLEFTLRQDDNPLVLAQRLCEWIGRAPAIEEDIAQTNVGLDLVGQARMWYAYAGEIETRLGRPSRGEDALAFRRD